MRNTRWCEDRGVEDELINRRADGLRPGSLRLSGRSLCDIYRSSRDTAVAIQAAGHAGSDLGTQEQAQTGARGATSKAIITTTAHVSILETDCCRMA
jgi:hypothetical protein